MDQPLEKNSSAVVKPASDFDVDSGSEEVIDSAAEAKLLAKLDFAFVPIIMLVYLSCFLDRSNIGNVKTAGMPKDIGASTQQFATAVSIFYATCEYLHGTLHKQTANCLQTSRLRRHGPFC